jgi:uncharacterized protein YmfQ (DUF2313 family)
MAYGLNAYGSGGYKGGGTAAKLHYYALKKISPWAQDTIDGDFDNDLDIKGLYLDLEYYEAQSLYYEFFISSTTALISDWCRVWGVNYTGNHTQDAAAVIAAMRTLANKNGRLRKFYYEQLAETIIPSISGYWRVVEGSTYMFRVGTAIPPATALSGQLWEAQTLYTWYLQTTDTVYNDNRLQTLRSLLSKQKPAHTEVWILGAGGFQYGPI